MFTRFAINVADANHIVHVGGQLISKTYIYAMPMEAIRLLKNLENQQYVSFSMSLVDDEPIKPPEAVGGEVV